jgi:hypothetical protein
LPVFFESWKKKCAGLAGGSTDRVDFMTDRRRLACTVFVVFDKE